MRRAVPGEPGRDRRGGGPPATLVMILAVALVLLGCSAPAATPTFGLAIRNSGDAPVRLKVITDPEARPSTTLLVPAHSAVLRTPTSPLALTSDGKAQPVSIEVYTDNCALLTTITAGEGFSRLDIGPDLGVTVTADAGPGGADIVEPDSAAGC